MILFFSWNEFALYIKGNDYTESIVFETLNYDNDVVYNVADNQAMIAF